MRLKRKVEQWAKVVLGRPPVKSGQGAAFSEQIFSDPDRQVESLVALLEHAKNAGEMWAVFGAEGVKLPVEVLQIPTRNRAMLLPVLRELLGFLDGFVVVDLCLWPESPRLEDSHMVQALSRHAFEAQITGVLLSPDVPEYKKIATQVCDCFFVQANARIAMH